MDGIDLLVRIAVAFIICSIIGLPAFRIRVVSLSGLLSGYIMGVGIIILGGWGAFAIILLFFILSGLATKFHYDKKKAKGIAEAKGGARGYKNVFGNGLFALIVLFLELIYGGGAFIAAYLGAVAAATADTAGGEFGRLSKADPWLITTFRRVPAGTDGGISLLGKGAEVAISLLIAIVAIAVGLSAADLPAWKIIITTTIGGVVGATVDSYLGATLESNVRWFSNNFTNFFCTVAGAVLAFLLFYLI
ncbi:DUF92 domain-containing protein [archaeon]|nr:MAG: DUF92 domain-containing protein [archaeon]